MSQRWSMPREVSAKNRQGMPQRQTIPCQVSARRTRRLKRWKQQHHTSADLPASAATAAAMAASPAALLPPAAGAACLAASFAAVLRCRATNAALSLAASCTTSSAAAMPACSCLQRATCIRSVVCLGESCVWSSYGLLLLSAAGTCSPIERLRSLFVSQKCQAEVAGLHKDTRDLLCQSYMTETEQRTSGKSAALGVAPGRSGGS
jgi:hypothetical protein